jgi:3-oxoacyl-[acyl-carrier-protein] synthase II
VTVITGLGTVSAAGVGRAALLPLFERGEPRVTEVDRSGGFHAPASARFAALVDRRQLDGLIPPLEARRMSPPSRFAVVAACAALEDAGIAIPTEPDPGLAVIAASALGPTSFTQKMIDQVIDEGPALASPMLFPETVANAPPARVALACRAAGPNIALAQSEAGPLRAVARAAREVAAGRAQVALAGGVDEMTAIGHAVLDRFRALSRGGTARPERARPFDRGRDGCLAAEGATFVVVETEEYAARRGARPLARILGAFSAFDPTAPASGWGTGAEGLASRVVAGLARLGLSPEGIDLVVSGASGSRRGDRLEALVLRRAWEGRRLPPVLAPKAWTGEYGGAFLGAAVLAALGARPAPASFFTEIDPELGIRPDPEGRKVDPGRVLVTTLAAGGAASWLVLERP